MAKAKKVLSLIVVFAFLMAMVAGCTVGTSSTTTGNTGVKTETKAEASTAGEVALPAKLSPKPVTLSLLTYSHPSYPYRKDWICYKLLEDTTNIHLDVEAVNTDSYVDKLNVRLASNQIPDITYMTDVNLSLKYGSEGAFVEIAGLMDKLPNFQKWTSTRQSLLSYYMGKEKKMYIFPNEGIGDVDVAAWGYRKDIFDKAGLAAPKTFEELYQDMKKLKELYPKSYPMTTRWGLGWLYAPAMFWNTGSNMYYNLTDKKFHYGALDPNFKTYTQWLAKCFEDKLMPPDFLTINTSTWENYYTNDLAFVCYDMLGRPVSFNTLMKDKNPAYDFEWFAPMKGDVPDGNDRLLPGLSIWGFAINAASKNKDIALKLMDWYYTDEGKLLSSWGKENVTFKAVNGEKVWIDPSGNSWDFGKALVEYGFHSIGVGVLLDPNAEIDNKAHREAMKKREPYVGELPRGIVLSIEDAKAYSDAMASIQPFVDEQIAKFITGARSMSEWDSFVNDLKGKGIEKWVDVHNSYLQ